MENTPVVNEPEATTPAGGETVTAPEPEATVQGEPEPRAPQAGEKTDPNLLLKSLQEERKKSRELEAELEELRKAPALSEEEVISDEGKALEARIKNLSAELEKVKANETKRDLIVTYPVLKDKWAEFEEFRSLPENKGMSTRTAAKAFLTENGFLEPTRKGLERPTGGPRTPVTSGKMTAEEVEHVRKTNFREYTRLLKAGLIHIE